MMIELKSTKTRIFDAAIVIICVCECLSGIVTPRHLFKQVLQGYNITVDGLAGVQPPFTPPSTPIYSGRAKMLIFTFFDSVITAQWIEQQTDRRTDS